MAILKDSANVSIFEQLPATPLPAETTFEPGFGYSRALTPNYSGPQWCDGLIKHLDRLIRRAPKDLTPHIQRINTLLVAGYRGDRVFAAAIDLNTVLGTNGLALQQRIHDQIFPVLNEQQRADLVAIRSGATFTARDAERLCTLTRSSGGGVQLVSKKQDELAGEIAPVDFDIGG